MKLIDSHCHLDDSRFEEDREAAIGRALEAGVERMLAVGTGEGPPDFETGIRLAEAYPALDASAGVHPHYAVKAAGGWAARLGEVLKHPKIVAVGEIGLDYHYDFSPRDVQRAVFAEQLRIARDAGKPVIIHTREAWDDTFALLEEHWRPSGLPGIMHCFSGGPAEALRSLEMNFYISFAGVVTFPKAVENREALKAVPSDRLLVETDAPYLAPAPLRGRRNEPAYVVHTAKKAAEVRGETLESVAETTTANYLRLMFASRDSQRLN